MTITDKSNEIYKATQKETHMASNKMDFSKSGTQAFQKELYSCVSMCIKQKKNEFRKDIL